MRATPVAVALGSNLGDRAGHLAYAVARLRPLLHPIRTSAWIETAPVGVPGPQPAFLNGVVVGESRQAPADLLAALQRIEQDRGRERPFDGAPRTLDLDLILYGDVVLAAAGLMVPHPRFRERRFVLAPLAEVAGEWMDPVTGQSVSALLRSLERPDRPS